MSLFSKKKFQAPSLEIKLETQYKAASYNLYLLVVFTAINIVLLLINSDRYFLFSASLPYYIVVNAMYLCGKMPDDYYDFEHYEYDFYDESIFTITIIVAVAITLLYLLCAIFSVKQRVGWIVAATIFFVIDTVAMFSIYGISADMILDILFHAWVLYYLIAGIIAHQRLKKLS